MPYGPGWLYTLVAILLPSLPSARMTGTSLHAWLPNASLKQPEVPVLFLANHTPHLYCGEAAAAFVSTCEQAPSQAHRREALAPAAAPALTMDSSA